MKCLSFILLCLLCSCGTSKRSTETERHVSTNINTLDSLFWRGASVRTELQLTEEMLNARIIITELSKPDSTGKQYPTKTTEIDLNTKKDQSNAKSDQAGLEATQVKKGDAVIQEDDKKKEEVKTDTRMIPMWVWWFLGVGGVIAALLCWRSRRKK